MNIINLLFGFDGRIHRLQWWFGMIAVEAVLMAVLWVLGIPTWNLPEALGLRFVGFLIEIVTLYPIAALAVKRLHDRGYTSWAASPWLAAFFASLVGDLFRFFAEPTTMTPWKLIVMIVLAAVELGYLIELGFRRGDAGPNQYGSDPLGGTGEATATG